MFQRYTERAQFTVVGAQGQARDLGFEQVGTEHLWLSLLQDGDSIAVKALRELGVQEASARAETLQLIGCGTASVKGEIAFSPGAKQVLAELAPAESWALGPGHVGPEHILLGLLREDGGVAARVLARCGVQAGSVREAVVRLLGARSPQASDRPAPAGRRRTRTPGEFDRAVRIVRGAVQEAEELDAPELGAEHFLLAVLADPEAADLADLLRVQGVTLEWLRDQFRPD